MPVPTKETFLEISKQYQELWNFPNCIGCIDGKHVRIIYPPHSGTMFYNYKKFYSIVLQAVCDANYRFIIIDVGAFGKQSDGGTFTSSEMYNLLESNQLNIPEDDFLPGTDIKMPFVFLADEAYPISVHVLTPYKSDSLNAETATFNARHSRARKTVECSFGILYSKWRILSKSIETSSLTADKIVKALCVLQNMIIDKEGVERHLTEVNRVEPRGHETIGRRCNNRGRPSNAAKIVRDTFKCYFMYNPINFPK